MNAPARELKVLELGMSWSAERPGGANRYFEDMLRHFSGEAGLHARAWVCASGAGSSVGDVPVRFIATEKAPLLTRLSCADRAIRETLEEWKPDLLASHFPLYALPLLWRARSLPLVCHFHGPWALESAAEGASSAKVAALRWLERRLYARAKRFVVLTRAFGKILEHSYGVEASRIRVIPPGFDHTRFHPSTESRSSLRARLGWPVDRPILLAVRRLARRMGLQNLIAAMTEVRKSHPNLLVLIAGRGQMEDELRQQIAELKLERTVRLIGYLDDALLPDAYRAADATILPSESLEGFGLSAAESLGCGTPCLVTRVGGLPEVVADLSSDLIIGHPAPEAIAQVLIEWQSGSRKLPSPEACTGYARSRFDWSRAVGAIRAVYEECL